MQRLIMYETPHTGATGRHVAARWEGGGVQRLTCKEVILDYLADYLDATLDPGAVADLERHLEGCAPCRAYLDTYKRTGKVARAAGDVQMPQEMKAHLRRFLLARLTGGQP
jgi:anti-sigma factor RsiW